MRRRLLALAALAALTGCGSSDDDGSRTSLTIVVAADADVDVETYTLTCDPPGGDHPQPQQACDVLADAGAGAFDAVPADQACTEIYGGPQTATITGTYEGRDVDATFSRQNGCEIDRWEKLGTTVLVVPLQ